MSRNARVEEVDTSDEDNFSDPDEIDISTIAPASKPHPSQTQVQRQNESLMNPSAPQLQPHFPGRGPPAQSQQAAMLARSKHFRVLYPIYFDSSRSRRSGRRVSKSNAVSSPLARSIVDAIASLGVGHENIIFEPGKTHPKDWANPGRVRVQIRASKEDGGAVVRPDVLGNKGELYEKVGRYLRENPTTERDPEKLRIQGVPLPNKEKGEGQINVPRGWKVGGILPLHSPARSGGGVDDVDFKGMLEEMQKQGGGGGMPGLGGMPGMGGAGGGMPDMSQLAGMLGGMGGGGAAGGRGSPSPGPSKKKDKKGKR